MPSETITTLFAPGTAADMKTRPRSRRRVTVPLRAYQNRDRLLQTQHIVRQRLRQIASVSME